MKNSTSPRKRTRRPASRPAKAGTPHHFQPSTAEIAAMHTLLAPWKWLTSPKFYGLEHVPTDRPALFVGNHTLMGVLDIPLMVMGLYDELGLFLRSLGDHLHFKIPLWGRLLATFGCVDGTPDNCRALMRARQSIVVFPGGGREVFKHKGERYKLLWKQRIGFARLAIELGYRIVPFASVGPEECYDILIDGEEVLHTPLRPLIERFNPRPDILPPLLVRGVGPSVLPRPERFYFAFAKPIDTAALAGRHSDTEVCFALREKVRLAVEAQIAFLQKERDHDAQRHFVSRLMQDILRSLGQGQ
jgi:1-acyl-sn-glycerol-3-phosphate acyltransferase